MNRYPPPPSTPNDGGEDRLLRRYHEANALDDARPDPALREAVLAHARSVAAAQKDGASPHARAPASNDPSWTLRALGSLAVLGLVGLLVLQFDRGSPEEREAAFGEPAAPAGVRPAPAIPENPPAAEPATAPIGSREAPATPSLKTGPMAPPVPDAARGAPVAATPKPAEARSSDTLRSAAPNAGLAPTPTTADEARDSMANTPPSLAAAAPAAPAAPAVAPSAGRAAPAPLTQADPKPSDTEQAAEAQELTRNTAAQRLEAPAADRARAALALPPLLAAAAQGDPAAVRRLLAAGTDVNTRDAAGRTTLMLAAQRGDAALVRLLLQAGADPALRDRQGLSAADHAAQAGHAGLLPQANTQPPVRP